jgi:hypothetical protein
MHALCMPDARVPYSLSCSMHDVHACCTCMQACSYLSHSRYTTAPLSHMHMYYVKTYYLPTIYDTTCMLHLTSNNWRQVNWTGTAYCITSSKKLYFVRHHSLGPSIRQMVAACKMHWNCLWVLSQSINCNAIYWMVYVTNPLIRIELEQTLSLFFFSILSGSLGNYARWIC